MDLKIVNYLFGQQSEYTKYPCFFCLWDSRFKDKHWVIKRWYLGKENVIAEALIDRDHLSTIAQQIGFNETAYNGSGERRGLLWLHIKKNYRAEQQEAKSRAFLTGRKIRELMKNPHFEDSMSNTDVFVHSSSKEFSWEL